MDILIRYARKKNLSLGITVRHHSASLVMPISDPRDRFFYPHHTPKKDTYCLTYEVRILTQSEKSVLFQSSGLPRSGKNIWKMTFFPGQGKVREFCGWPGKFRKDLERQGKVRELKKMAMAGSLQKIYLFCSRGEKRYFLRDGLSPSPSSLGVLLKKRICSLGEQILSFKSTPKFEVIQLAPLE